MGCEGRGVGTMVRIEGRKGLVKQSLQEEEDREQETGKFMLS
jgi:hypothetical protein